MSRFVAFNFKHDDVTFQVPTTLPPQAVTLGQEVPEPPVPVVPALPLGELPPMPVGFPNPALHATEIIPKAAAIARAAD
jgi:hypothetical protein